MKNKIIEMLLAGVSYNKICQVLGVSKSTVAYHANMQGISKGKKFERGTYDWKQIQQEYDSGLCNRELSIKLNIPTRVIREAIKDGRLIVDHYRKCKDPTIMDKIPSEVLFKENSNHDSSVARKYVIKYNLLPYYCSNQSCMLFNVSPVWCGNVISLHLDHINGNNRDHRLLNLRWLCPNCHSQTPTYAGKNKKKLVPLVGVEPTT